MKLLRERSRWSSLVLLKKSKIISSVKIMSWLTMRMFRCWKYASTIDIKEGETFCCSYFISSVFAKYQEHLNCVVDRPVVGHAEPGELRVVFKQGLIPGEHLISKRYLNQISHNHLFFLTWLSPSSRTVRFSIRLMYSSLSIGLTSSIKEPERLST